MECIDTSFIGILGRTDPSFRVLPDLLKAIVNASGYEVGIRRRMAHGGYFYLLDSIRIKQQLGKRPSRDPLESKKDLLQADVIEQLWGEYLQHNPQAATL